MKFRSVILDTETKSQIQDELYLRPIWSVKWFVVGAPGSGSSVPVSNHECAAARRLHDDHEISTTTSSHEGHEEFDEPSNALYMRRESALQLSSSWASCGLVVKT